MGAQADSFGRKGMVEEGSAVVGGERGVRGEEARTGAAHREMKAWRLWLMWERVGEEGFENEGLGSAIGRLREETTFFHTEE